MNKQTESLTGCTRDELIGAPFKKYFTDPDRAEACIGQVIAEGKITDCELSARAERWHAHRRVLHANTFHDRDRRVQGVFAAARDMTQLKRIEQTLQQKKSSSKAPVA